MLTFFRILVVIIALCTSMQSFCFMVMCLNIYYPVFQYFLTRSSKPSWLPGRRLFKTRRNYCWVDACWDCSQGAWRKKGQSRSNRDIWSPVINPVFFFFYRFLIKYLHSSYETYPRMLPAVLLSSAILGADVRNFAGSSLPFVEATAAAAAAAEDAGGADDHNCASAGWLFFPLIERCDLFPHVQLQGKLCPNPAFPAVEMECMHLLVIS